MNADTKTFSHWQRLARRTVWKVNLGWCWQCLTPWLMAGGFIAAVVILWARTQGHPLSFRWPAWLAGLGALFIIGYVQARRHFIGQNQALVRLESRHHLHNALTMAQLGRGDWPPVPAAVKDGLAWRWMHLSGPLAASLGCLLLAWHIPITPEAVAAIASVEPQSWQQMDDWLEKLQEEKIITPESSAAQQAKLDALRQQPNEKWFSHESLNASDTLKEQLQREIANMGRQMSNAERSLNALQNYGDKLSEAAKEQMLQEFDQALAEMRSGTLEIDSKLMEELSQMDLKNLKSLSQEQLNQLRESLKNKGGTCDGFGENKGFVGDGRGESEMPGEGPGQKPGKGGADRGPGTAPLTLSKEVNDFGAGKNEGIDNQDLSRAQIGSMLGLQDGKHQVDKTSTGPTAAGATSYQGQGGQQIWRESLSPEEKAVLKRVFK
jgi:hypothetical protein